VKRLGRLLSLLAVAASLSGTVRPVLAEPDIEISFERDGTSAHSLIRAEALFPAPGADVQRVFAAISAYPELHDWIRATQLVRKTAQGEEFLVEFEFPWPVGKQWSRVEVRRHDDSAIEWHQIEGSLKANRGRIAFATRDGAAHIDYRAVIDVGFPDALTRPYKKRFVSEFLGAVYQQARSSDTATAIALASGTQP
jgi:uncharacterized membrane protein